MPGCTCCQIDAFLAEDEWKEHHKSDFHRYNLKRRVADLPPVDQGRFERKLELLKSAAFVSKGESHLKTKRPQSGTSRGGTAQTGTPQTGTPQTGTPQTGTPQTATPQTGTPQTGTQTGTGLGLTTGKNRADPQSKSSDTGGGSLSGSGDSQDANLADKADESNGKEFQPTMCLFDNTTHNSVTENLEYMKKTYKFFIPEEGYVHDVEGLLRVLGRKLCERHQCLFCNREFASLSAVRSHMTDTSHTLLGMSAEELDDEYHEFYDFSSSHAELVNENQKMIDGGSTILVAALEKGEPSHGVVDGAESNEQSSDADGEWEDLDSDDDDDHSNHKDKNWDTVVKKLGLQYAAITEAGNLTLPTGKEIAPRQLAYIYRQHIPMRAEAAHIKSMKALRASAPLQNTGRGVLEVWHNKESKQRQAARWQRHWNMDKQVQRCHYTLSKRDVKLGVKRNKLQCSLKRDNLVII